MGKTSTTVKGALFNVGYIIAEGNFRKGNTAVESGFGNGGESARKADTLQRGAGVEGRVADMGDGVGESNGGDKLTSHKGELVDAGDGTALYRVGNGEFGRLAVEGDDACGAVRALKILHALRVGNGLFFRIRRIVSEVGACAVIADVIGDVARHKCKRAAKT